MTRGRPERAAHLLGRLPLEIRIETARSQFCRIRFML